MSDITRDEAKKASKFVDRYLTNSDLPYNKNFSEALHKTQLFINQQPQLSDDAYDKLQIEMESYLDDIAYKELEPYMIDVMNLIYSQASEIDRLKEELHRAKIDYGYDITEKGMANKELKDKLNAMSSQPLSDDVEEALFELGEIEFEDIKSFYDDEGDLIKVSSTKQYRIIEQKLQSQASEIDDLQKFKDNEQPLKEEK